MTGMEHAVEQVRQAMQDAMKTYGPFSGTDQAQHVYDYLHALGLLAPAPLTEIRAENLFGETHRRYVSDWEPVDRAEGESWYDAEPDAMPDAGWEPMRPDHQERHGRPAPKETA